MIGCMALQYAQSLIMSGSFMDYALPRADFLPSFNCELIEVPATSHRYGIRPGGEGGTTPALGAVINAVIDALVALYRGDQLRGHLERALANGVTKDELVELITHLAFYSGWPTAMSAATLAKEVFEAEA